MPLTHSYDFYFVFLKFPQLAQLTHAIRTEAARRGWPALFPLIIMGDFNLEPFRSWFFFLFCYETFLCIVYFHKKKIILLLLLLILFLAHFVHLLVSWFLTPLPQSPFFLFFHLHSNLIWLAPSLQSYLFFYCYWTIAILWHQSIHCCSYDHLGARLIIQTFGR